MRRALPALGLAGLLVLGACEAPATMPDHASIGYAFDVDMGDDTDFGGFRILGETASGVQESTTAFAAFGMNSYEVGGVDVEGVHLELSVGVRRWYALGPLLWSAGIELGAGILNDNNPLGDDTDLLLFAGPIAAGRIPLFSGLTLDADLGYRWTSATDNNDQQPDDLDSGLSGVWAVVALGYDF